MYLGGNVCRCVYEQLYMGSVILMYDPNAIMLEIIFYIQKMYMVRLLLVYLKKPDKHLNVVSPYK